MQNRLFCLFAIVFFYPVAVFLTAGALIAVSPTVVFAIESDKLQIREQRSPTEFGENSEVDVESEDLPHLLTSELSDSPTTGIENTEVGRELAGVENEFPVDPKLNLRRDELRAQGAITNSGIGFGR